MKKLSLRLTAAGIAFAATAAPATSAAQLPTTVRVDCVGGAIGCSQLDFFIQFVGLASPITLDAFTLSLRDPGYVFSSPGTTEAEDALGFNFYNPSLSADGRTLRGTFDFGAFLDPAITSTLRIRTEMAVVPSGTTSADAMPFAYSASAGTTIYAAGIVDPPPPPVVATPEPASLILLATGFAGIGAWSRRRRRTAGLEAHV